MSKLARFAGMGIAAIVLGTVLLWGCRGSGPGVLVPTKETPTKETPTKEKVSNLTVRGYLAVAVGNSGLAEKEGIFARGVEQKDIFVPGVEVRLNDPQTGRTSEPVRTDLSGRFTLFAPAKGRYQLCWKSKAYDAGCTKTFIDVNDQPQFLSTVHMAVPFKQGLVSVMGRVKDAAGESVRTLEPYLNVNAFATVSLQDDEGGSLSEVYVNNFGDYLLPYVPVKRKVKVVTRIESARFEQEIWPEAELGVARLHQMNLKFENTRPRLDPLVVVDSNSNRRIQNAAPGSTLNVKANARDKDGDPVNFAWFIDPSEGQLAQTTGAAVQWKLPATPGRYSVTVVAYDKKGGYDKAILSVLADGGDIPFSGIVVEPNGTPVAGASIEIVGNPIVMTDARGHFEARAKEAERYVFNVRKEGYALNSRLYNAPVVAGRWILRPAQLVTIDPTKGGNITITHRRTQRDCPGPDSERAGLGAAGKSLLVPQWQDGKGNVIDPPLARDESRSIGVRGNRVISPRGLQLGECGPGIEVVIPAGSILDASGKPATAPFKVGVSTVDLLSPQQMPGDDSVVPLGGGGAFLQSYGAGALDLPTGFKLKPGVQATISIPVDRARRGAGALPGTIPLLAYDERKGLWLEEGKLNLSNAGGVQAYVGKVSHFTTYNADTFFNNAACLRVFSPSLPGQYNLEVMSPYPDGTPHYKNYPIDNVSSTEHVIYNITPNANMTLAPMTTGPNPQLLGFYEVNSGPPQSPSNSPNVPPGPPYTSCQNFVVLKVNSAPDSPFGGEFLHGLGYIGATNLGFASDLDTAAPTGNALRDAIIAASNNYYGSVDPKGWRKTFAEFKSLHGFADDPNTPAADEIVAQYANSGDLGFGRDMHCLKKASGDVACYVTNYGDGYKNIPPGGGTDDHDDANAAGSRDGTKEVATVAMEYSPIEDDPAGDRVVKFFVYKKALPGYGRSISANLDGRGERPVPQLCMICHGGKIPNQAAGVPAFGTAAQVKLDARFVPFDHRFYTFPTVGTLSKANQEAAFKLLNEQIVNAAPVAGPTDPIHEVVAGMYNNGASPTQIRNFTVPGWAAGASANESNQAAFYTGVVADACRMCHIAQPYPQLQFNNSDRFINVSNAVTNNNKLMLGTAQLRVCGDYVMPHALRTHDIFWGIYWDVPEWGPPPTPYNTQFQNFGNGVGGSTWDVDLCTSVISGSVSSPSQFYQQAIQPIWNGKCVACHVAGGQADFLPLTEGAPFNEVRARVVPGNDNNNAGELLRRITGVGPGDKMPLNCIESPTPPAAGQLPCLPQSDIDKIKAWIRSGAN
ncbi:carboxypeptidase regulatory-like domain-containing protein [Archangium gephyra]|nr:carboxypeptidase regulatory-like domain-containing protein [Archangium gephyra]